MSREITDASAQRKNLVVGTTAWAWLFEVQIDGSEAVRITSYNADISHGGYTFTAYPVTVGPQASDSRAGLNTVEVRVTNVQRFLMPYLESGALLGLSAKVRLVNVADVTDAVLEDEYEVLGATATETQAVFTLGMQNILSMSFPLERALRTRCRWLKEYGGGRCQYDTTLTDLVGGDFDPAACDGTLDGANGCRAHGDNEVANGMPRLHPLRFGGFPGIPRGRIVR